MLAWVGAYTYVNDICQGLFRTSASTRPAKIDADAEARLIALTCGDPPEGRTRWTLRLLAERLVQLDQVPLTEVSHETVRQVLQKTNSSPG